MEVVETTKMSSKGQVVIPEGVRSRLGLKAGDKFVVIGEKDVVILKALPSPSIDQFDAMIKVARKQARAAGLTRLDVTDAIAESRRRR